jgi:ATP-dependent DNA helicase RecQ
LIEHFGQAWNRGPCNACDVCLGKLEVVADALVIGQKILSCVLRTGQRFGADYVSLVLAGSRDQRVLAAGHDRLSTWGILSEVRRQDVRQWIEQLVNQGFLTKDGEYHTLQVTEQGRRLLAGKVSPTLTRPNQDSRTQTPSSVLDSWEGVDLALFDSLRQLRHEEASARGVPAYILFSDATLRDMSRRRPSSVERLLNVHGVGQQKAADFGQQFVERIVTHCQQHGLAMDVLPMENTQESSTTPSANAVRSFELFDQGLSVEQVAERLGRAASTVHSYLEAYIRHRRITDVSQWVSQRELEQVKVVIQYAGSSRLRPIFDALHGRVSYDRIRIAMAWLESQTVKGQDSNAPIESQNAAPHYESK